MVGSTSTQDLISGEILAVRFRLIKSIGEGTTSSVWSAVDLDSDYRVALKILRNPDQQAAFKAEWMTLRSLNHPHVVRVFDYFENPRPFYAMFLVDGSSLASIGSVNSSDVLKPLGLVCRALAYMHRRDVIHGDINAGNILFDAGGAPFLVDFGSARRGDIDVGLSDTAPAYRNPKRAPGAGVSAADDLYALGKLASEVTANVDRLDGALVELLRRMQQADENAPGADDVEKQLQALGVSAGPLPAFLLQASHSVTPDYRAEDIITPHTRISSVSAPVRPITRANDADVGFKPMYVWATLAALVLVIVYVAVFLEPPEPRAPVEQAPIAERAAIGELTAPAIEVKDGIDGEKIEFSEGDDDDSMRTEAVQRKNRTDRLLGRLLTKQEVLQKRGVELWAGTVYSQAMERYQSGDRYYLAKDYDKAGAAYQETIDMFDRLIGQVDSEFLEVRGRAFSALESADGAEAERLFARSLAISPADQASLDGLERAKNLDTVLGLIKVGGDAESDEQFEAARVAYEKAIAIDRDWQPAVSGLARVEAIIAEQEFQALMTDGFLALDAGKLGAAGVAFRAAKVLNPQSAEPLDGLLQVDQAGRLGKISQLEGRALSAESSEDWAGAEQAYKAMLEQDANLVIAEEGLRNARARIALDQELTRYIADPDALVEAKVMNAAAGLLPKIARIKSQGPRLTAQKRQLSEILKRAVNPIPVQLVSDELTDVAVFKVGKLGRFAATELSLRPGLYTAVGSRPGYKDVRLTFRVAPEHSMSPVIVRCEEPI